MVNSWQPLTSHITKNSHDVILPFERHYPHLFLQPPHYPNSKTPGGDWNSGQDTHVSCGNVCHQLAHFSPSVNQPFRTATTLKITLMHLKLISYELYVNHTSNEKSPLCNSWTFCFLLFCGHTKKHLSV